MGILKVRSCKCGGELFTKSNTCNPCARLKAKARRDQALEDGRTKQEVYNYAFRVKNPKAYLLHSAKSRAKKKGWDFNLEVEDFEIPEVCPILGIPLFIRSSAEDQTKNPNNPSLDRINSDLGYVKGNVQVISWRANDLKKDGSAEEFKKLSEYLNGKKG